MFALGGCKPACFWGFHLHIFPTQLEGHAAISLDLRASAYQSALEELGLWTLKPSALKNLSLCGSHLNHLKSRIKIIKSFEGKFLPKKILFGGFLSTTYRGCLPIFPLSICHLRALFLREPETVVLAVLAPSKSSSSSAKTLSSHVPGLHFWGYGSDRMARQSPPGWHDHFLLGNLLLGLGVDPKYGHVFCGKGWQNRFLFT